MRHVGGLQKLQSWTGRRISPETLVHGIADLKRILPEGIITENPNSTYRFNGLPEDIHELNDVAHLSDREFTRIIRSLLRLNIFTIRQLEFSLKLVEEGRIRMNDMDAQKRRILTKMVEEYRSINPNQ